MALSSLVRRSGDYAWRGLDAGLMLGTAPDAAMTVGARVLDVAAGERTPRDRALLEEVAEECLADLRTRLAQLAEAPRAAEWRPLVPAPGWTATIGGAHGPLALALSDATFAALVRRVLPVAPADPLGSGAAALAAQGVTVSAALGSAGLSVADLQALEIGDVVVLDRPLAAPVPIAVDGTALARGRVRVVAAEPHPILEVVSSVA